MYRNFSFAAALLAAAFSGQALADGINNFSQAKRRASKSMLTRPAAFTAGAKSAGRVKKAS